MIYFILQLFIPNTIEDITELMSLDTYILAPIFLILAIVCLIVWLVDRHNKNRRNNK